ncbi:alanine/glycine:cation symporter family protein [Dermatophilus congolensis]|uniref:Na+/alanine symporter n=1 Tax=Dermatophilus congolensis TaxID=1863 RepID=A0A239V429_9MICO|nr:alanine/glycine:cation symporter family protein [Dermatophilus congolensis]MBO3143507.1 alanine:cation symporter family protein [Dermatophilus congolensis]MBO3152498.1 alanine:cation symporter family protein [Dermatophilus congolensis]MBO3160491.1 alanine:cation symporter family protein [Dermatophilus congolensis]MBO3163784.1 alanine:cation symporter family protein [Dermatophilus congolensis]MBO3177330.1 alanine:cation symporter family protein [Dermatophilus congolensis]
MADLLTAVSDVLYKYILIALLIGAGLYFSVRTGFVQLRLLPESVRVVTEPKEEGESLSSFSALMVSTASRVGTGNIAGVAVAIVLGGPGALFWMWLIALLGASSAFIESTLAQIYKRRGENNVSYGGPAYYITTALKARWLGVVFACALIFTYMGGFNMVASYNTVDSFRTYGFFSESTTPLILGAALALPAALPIFGGGQRLAHITSMLVPFMAIAYLLAGCAVVFTHLHLVPDMFAAIFSSAFDFSAIFGGFAGSAMMHGIKRGLYSNEAGVGSAPNAAASASVSHPVKQGLVQMLSVYIDTWFVCTITGFTVLASGVVPDEKMAGVAYVQAAVATVFGAWGPPFITMCLVLFAFTTLIGNYYYSEVNLRFLCHGEPAVWLLRSFRAVAVLIVFCGALLEFEMAWSIADILMGLMALINIPVIILLGGHAIKASKNYIEQRKQGVNPTFRAADIGITEKTDYWGPEPQPATNSPATA